MELKNDHYSHLSGPNYFTCTMLNTLYMLVQLICMHFGEIGSVHCFTAQYTFKYILIGKILENHYIQN